MPGYLIANLTVTDPAGYGRYTAAVPAVVARYGGRYLVRGGATTDREGAFGFDRLVILEFPSIDQVRAFYDSPEYAPLLALRTASTRSSVSFAEGTAPG